MLVRGISNRELKDRVLDLAKLVYQQGISNRELKVVQLGGDPELLEDDLGASQIEN